MAVVNQYKFKGIDNNTSGSALTPLGASIPLQSMKLIVVKSILSYISWYTKCDCNKQ